MLRISYPLSVMSHWSNVIFYSYNNPCRVSGKKLENGDYEIEDVNTNYLHVCH